MARIEPTAVVPELRKLASELRDKQKKERVETLAETVDLVLSEAEEVRAATRNLSILNQTQRDSLHALIKEYSKLIDDVDTRSKLLSEAGQIMRRTN